MSRPNKSGRGKRQPKVSARRSKVYFMNKDSNGFDAPTASTNLYGMNHNRATLDLTAMLLSFAIHHNQSPSHANAETLRHAIEALLLPDDDDKKKR